MTEATRQIVDPRFPLSLRMRPEMLGDADALQNALKASLQSDLAASMCVARGDIEIVATSPGELASLILTLNSEADLHRMMQTLDLSDSFTGEWIEGHPDRAKRVLGALGDDHPQARRVYLLTFQLEAVTETEPS